MNKIPKKIVLTLVLVATFLLGILFFRIISQSSRDYKEVVKIVTPKELDEKLKQKEEFILYVYKDSCEICKEFYPRYEKIIKNDSQSKKYIKINSASHSTYVKNILKDKYQGTPAVYFFKKGVLEDYFIGSQSDNTIKHYLNEYGVKING